MYEVIFRNPEKLTERFSPGVQVHPVCVLPISLGQEYHVGEQLEAIFAAAEKTFNKVVVVLPDTLYAYTLQITRGLSEEEAKVAAIQEGQKWLAEANQRGLAKLKIESEIKYWEALISHNDNPEYVGNLKLFEQIYEQGKLLAETSKKTTKKECIKELDEGKNKVLDFYQTVKEAAGAFLASCIRKNKAQPDDLNHARELCVKYILEVSAVIATFYRLGGYMAYPVSHNPANKKIFASLFKIIGANSEVSEGDKGIELLDIGLAPIVNKIHSAAKDKRAEKWAGANAHVDKQLLSASSQSMFSVNIHPFSPETLAAYQGVEQLLLLMTSQFSEIKASLEKVQVRATKALAKNRQDELMEIVNELQSKQQLLEETTDKLSSSPSEHSDSLDCSC